MKINLLNLFIICLFLTACSVNSPLARQDSQVSIFGNQLLIGQDFLLEQGSSVNGDIVGVGTSLTLNQGSSVNGNVILIGSTLVSSGTIIGDLNIFAGSSQLLQGAKIEGDINQFLNKTDMDKNSIITGDINTFIFPNFPADRFSGISALLSEYRLPGRMVGIQLASILIFALLALLTVLLFRKFIFQITKQISSQPIAAWCLGACASLGIPIIAIILVLSLCLLPFGILIIFLFFVAYCIGWVALGIVLGTTMQSWLHANWTLEIRAFLGVFILCLLGILLSWIPCIGWVINLSLSWIGLGAVLLGLIKVLSSKHDNQIKKNNDDSEHAN